jgi:hypothetical protein
MASTTSCPPADTFDSLVSTLLQPKLLPLKDQLSLIRKCPVTPATAKQCVSFLTRQLNGLLLDTLNDADEELIDQISALISNLSAVGGSSASSSRKWTFPGVELDIRELTFGKAAFGWTVWGSAIVFAQ